jgi:branched-chain amino acid transport system ATP-binding protein
MPDPALQISGLDVRYGRLPALTGLNLTLQRGEAIGLLGANGAGKTTLLNTLSGFLRPSAGTIEMFGRQVGHSAPHAIVREGLLHVSQERDLFGDLTVLDNLRLGSMARAADRFEQNVERVYGYFPRLKERAGQRAATMSGGEQQMLAIGRALMAEPRILLFDEPSAGLSPHFVGEIGAMMCALRETGELSILLVEQNMRLAAQVVNRFYILRAGVLVAQGPVGELKEDHEELAREFYL